MMTTSEISAPENVSAPCASCGELRTGRFCASCGEKVVEPEDYSLRTFLQETLHAFLTTESSTWRSFIMLLTRPGQITLEHLAGRRIGYLKPLQLFLFCNIVFFLVQSYITINTFTTPLQVQMYRQPYSAMVEPLVKERVAKRGISFEKYQKRFNEITETQAKTLVITMVPFVALVLQLLFWRSRRFYGEHLVFALHYFAFLLLVLPFILFVVCYVLRMPEERPRDLSVAFLLAIYLSAAIQRVYNTPLGVAIFKAVAVLFAFLGGLYAYRLLLFFVAYYSV